MIKLNQVKTMIRKGGENITRFFIQRKEKIDALYWDQVVSMAAVGLVLYVLVQNNSNAQNLGTTIITTMQTTLQSMLTQSY